MDDEIFQERARCAGLLLAAGGGRRMGCPKALVEFEGRLLVERAAEVLRDGGCDPVVVVLGAGADEVRHRADLSHARILDNPNWAEGQAGSLRIGLVGVADSDVLPVADPGTGEQPPETGTEPGAVVIALVDQPAIRPAVVRRLIDAWRAGAGPAVIAAYHGEPRNPVLVDRSVWADVAANVEGDEGARLWLREVQRERPERIVLVECADIGDPVDVDTPEDLRALSASTDERLAPAGRRNRSRS